ncbi:MAG: UvrD-helicase domain-containing protein [Treponema sp.]|uniref:ATP-dependent helicase n=1 Tax=Treponema sp. TaxID=166 RepID=UPI001DAA8E74|nr:UvrD-helicase domain-containing protein [Treponema sp.]MBS7242014.1 UvrD-helicase domain-containing protein [Treponema sp.]
MDSEGILSVLNPEQREAVVHEGSPLLILAGAGSGKTRVITTKIAWLISELNYNPSSILAVTFTKKAANEMKERAVALEPRSSWSQIRTFHSFGAYFLRQYASDANMGLDSNFTVYDDDDMVTLITKADERLTKKDASHYAHLISLAKDYCLKPDSLELATVDDDPRFPEVYEAYEKRLRATGNVDFGDLIMLPYLILKDNDLIRTSIRSRYKVIMVDEYQDSNVAQYKLLQQLSGYANENDSKAYVCVVGDDDQSIYKFRGAEVQNILNFKDQFPGTKIVRLETNYRSTSEILDCAASVVENNEGRLGKKLVAARGQGKKPALVFLPTQDDETEFCYSLIEQAWEQGVPYSDWAILYRTNAQSLGFETEFLHRKIPYQVVGSLKFYEREEVKDTIAWLSFVLNPRDEISFRRIINKPVRGIGNKTQDNIIEAGLGRSLVEAIPEVKLSKKAREGADSFVALVKKFSTLLPDVPVSSEAQTLAEQAIETEEKESIRLERKLSEFVQSVVTESGLEEFHKEQDDVTGSQKVANLEELVNSAVLYPCTKQGLIDFLDHINLDRTLDAADENSGETDRVTLITLHNTKGLEFPRVIITGLESGIFPRDGKTEAELEEERRLFYVGITRAKDELYFTNCSIRRLYGKTNPMMPSPFLSELGDDNVRVLGQKPASFGSGSGSKDPIESKYCRGANVYHDDWGYGVIVRTEHSDEGEYVVTVNFDTGGYKKFLPKYQKSSLLIVE